MNNKILIRFDDLCPTMNFEQWSKATRILDEYNIKPLIGVVPDNIDSELIIDREKEWFWSYLVDLQKKGYKIAMHGYQHSYDIKKKGLISRGLNSEFAGHPYEIQYSKIKKGKEILKKHGIDTEVFFAPSHSYDKNTLLALKNNGFKYMSDGKTPKIKLDNGILCVPSEFGSIAKFEKRGNKCVVFHTNEWTRPEKRYGYDNLAYICEKYGERITDFDTYVDEEVGNFFVQTLLEKMTLAWEYNIKEKLAKYYHFIKKA